MNARPLYRSRSDNRAAVMMPQDFDRALTDAIAAATSRASVPCYSPLSRDALAVAAGFAATSPVTALAETRPREFEGYQQQAATENASVFMDGSPIVFRNAAFPEASTAAGSPASRSFRVLRSRSAGNRSACRSPYNGHAVGRSASPAGAGSSFASLAASPAISIPASPTSGGAPLLAAHLPPPTPLLLRGATNCKNAAAEALLASSCRVVKGVNEPMRSWAVQGGKVDAFGAYDDTDTSRFARGNLLREVRGGLTPLRVFTPPVKAPHPALKERHDRLARAKFRGGVSFVEFQPSDAVGALWPVAICFQVPTHPTRPIEKSHRVLPGLEPSESSPNRRLFHPNPTHDAQGPFPYALRDVLDKFTEGYSLQEVNMRRRCFVTFVGWVRPTSHPAKPASSLRPTGPQQRERLLSRSTPTTLNATRAFQMAQRKEANAKAAAEWASDFQRLSPERRLDKQLDRMRSLAALNGETFLEPSDEFKVLMLDRMVDDEREAQSLNHLLSDAVDPRHKGPYSSVEVHQQVRRILQHEMGSGPGSPKLRDNLSVPPSVPDNFERYEGLEIVAITDAVIRAAAAGAASSQSSHSLTGPAARALSSSHGGDRRLQQAQLQRTADAVSAELQRDLQRPRFITSAWACPIDRIMDTVRADKHVGFVRAVHEDLGIRWDQPTGLTELLGALPSNGACALDVIAPDGAAFRHAFTFEPL
jgi:hypothetical protein